MPIFTHTNIRRDRLTPPGGRNFRASQDLNGKWTATLIFNCHFLDVVSLSPVKGSACPREGFGFLGFQRSDITDLKGGTSEITATYVGTTLKYPDEVDAELPPSTTELQLTSAEEPVETHLRYAGLTAKESEAVHDLRQGKLKIITNGGGTKYFRKDEAGATVEVTADLGAAAVELIGKIIRGVDIAFDFGLIWAVKFSATTKLTTNQLNAFNTITPPPGDPPTLSGRDYRFSGAVQTEEGSMFNISLNFQLSGPGGWDQQLYNPTAPPPS